MKSLKLKKLSGKIILVDDQKYEKDLLELALEEKGWEVQLEYFNAAEDALGYLGKTLDEIFLIISDMDMPKMNGLEFKKAIEKNFDAHRKSIPFIFASNADTTEKIKEAFLYRAQGFFRKAPTVDEQAEMLDIIIRYWIVSNHPYKDSGKENTKLL